MSAYSVLRHRSIFDLHSLQEDGDAFTAAAELVVDWVVQKELGYGSSPVADDFDGRRPFPLAWDYAMPEDYRGGDFDGDRWPAVAFATQRDDEGEAVRWVMEYDEPDVNHDDRRWHTTVCLARTETEACRVAVQSVCRPLDRHGEPLPETIAAPSLVRSLIDLPWYAAKVGTTQLQTVPNKLSVQTFDHFADSLTDPGRGVPLVLFCTGYDGKIPEQAKQLARRALGVANVYVLDWSNEELREKELKLFERGTPAGEYACPKSSCRMYMPGVDLANPNASMAHESWNREALQELRPSQFAERLARRFIPSEVVPSIADLGLAGDAADMEAHGDDAYGDDRRGDGDWDGGRDEWDDRDRRGRWEDDRYDRRDDRWDDDRRRDRRDDRDRGFDRRDRRSW